MKILITMEVDDEYVDPDHAMGVTEEAYLGISEALGNYGQDIDIQKVGG
jgi:hypothetical protein